MHRLLPAALFALCCVFAPHALAMEPEVVTDDVTRFYALYDAENGRPSEAQLDAYLAGGSESLRTFAQLRRVTGARIAERIAEDPAMYDDARRCLALLPEVTRRVSDALRTLARLYPEATFPPVAIVVGRGRPVGITAPTGVTIGLEAMCAADFMNPDPEDRFVHVIAHEYAHIQQVAAEDPPSPGDPRATVLRMSLVEGAAEFVAELISGGVGNSRHAEWTRGREAEIESAFLAAKDGTELDGWIFDYRPGSDEPFDLGYWVGYRVAKAYYLQAADKREALARIFAMEDPEAFLRESGWTPGMSLPAEPVVPWMEPQSTEEPQPGSGSP